MVSFGSEKMVRGLRSTSAQIGLMPPLVSIRQILMKAWVRSLGRFVGGNAANEITRQLSAGELVMVRKSEATQATQEPQATLQVRESDYPDLHIEMLEQRSGDQTSELQARELDTQQVFQNVLLLTQMEGIEAADLGT